MVLGEALKQTLPSEILHVRWFHNWKPPKNSIKGETSLRSGFKGETVSGDASISKSLTMDGFKVNSPLRWFQK